MLNQQRAAGLNRSSEPLLDATRANLPGEFINNRLPLLRVDVLIDAAISDDLYVMFRFCHKNQQACTAIGMVQVVL